jgi:hypothetical protein
MTLQAPHCLVMGPPGSGKTTSFVTFAKKGIEVFVIITEPTGVDSLLDAWGREKADINLLHYAVVPPVSGNWDALKEMGQKIKLMNYEDLSKLKSGVGKEFMNQYAKILNLCQNFTCERTQKEYGDVTSWDAKRCLGMDSLSGLSTITMQTTVGLKPSPHQGEWGIAMSATEQFLLKLSSDCQCFFVLTAHVEKEPDEITGASNVTVSTLGRKLAPKIPRFFSEVIRARRDPSKTPPFRWATLDSETMGLKNRALSAASDLPQDFGPVVDAFHRRQAASSAVSAAPAVASPQQAT